MNEKNIKFATLIAAVVGAVFALTGGIVYYVGYNAGQYLIRPPVVRPELDALHGLVGFAMVFCGIVAIFAVIDVVFSKKTWSIITLLAITLLAFIVKTALIILLFRNSSAVTNSTFLFITSFVTIVAFAVILCFMTTRMIAK